MEKKLEKLKQWFVERPLLNIHGLEKKVGCYSGSVSKFIDGSRGLSKTNYSRLMDILSEYGYKEGTYESIAESITMESQIGKIGVGYLLVGIKTYEGLTENAIYKVAEVNETFAFIVNDLGLYMGYKLDTIGNYFKLSDIHIGDGIPEKIRMFTEKENSDTETTTKEAYTELTDEIQEEQIIEVGSKWRNKVFSGFVFSIYEINGSNIKIKLGFGELSTINKEVLLGSYELIENAPQDSFLKSHPEIVFYQNLSKRDDSGYRVVETQPYIKDGVDNGDIDGMPYSRPQRLTNEPQPTTKKQITITLDTESENIDIKCESWGMNKIEVLGLLKLACTKFENELIK